MEKTFILHSAVLNLLLQSIIISNSNAHTLSKTCIIQLFFSVHFILFNVEVTFKLVAVRLEWLIFFSFELDEWNESYYELCCNYLTAICTMIFRIIRIMLQYILFQEKFAIGVYGLLTDWNSFYTLVVSMYIYSRFNCRFAISLRYCSDIDWWNCKLLLHCRYENFTIWRT